MAADASALDLRSVGCLTANRAVEKADAVAVMRKHSQQVKNSVRHHRKPELLGRLWRR